MLTALPRLAHDVGRASGLVDVLSRLLRDTTVDSGGAGEALAIRPDPVGDHLLMSVLASDPGFATMLLTTPPDRPHGPRQQHGPQDDIPAIA